MVRIIYFRAIWVVHVALWRKRLGACLPPLAPRVRISVTPFGFRGGRNVVSIGFSRGFLHFPPPQILFHHISTFMASIYIHFISPCDGATGLVGRYPCNSLIFNIGVSSYFIPRPDPVSDKS